MHGRSWLFHKTVGGVPEQWPCLEGGVRVNHQDEQKGDRGSPCRSPQPCFSGSPITPLIKTLDVAVDRRAETHSRNLLGKSRCRRRSKRKSHRTESKAFLMSSLNSSVGILLRWNFLAKLLTYVKLSWMLLFLMKAL